MSDSRPLTTTMAPGGRVTTLLKYRLHKEQDLFDRAYGYIQQYY